MRTLPRLFDLLVHVEGSNLRTPAEAFEPEVIGEPGPLGAERAVRGGGMDSNCMIPRPPVMGIIRVTLPDGCKGMFTPRIGEGKGGFQGLLVAV